MPPLEVSEEGGDNDETNFCSSTPTPSQIDTFIDLPVCLLIYRRQELTAAFSSDCRASSNSMNDQDGRWRLSISDKSISNTQNEAQYEIPLSVFSLSLSLPSSGEARGKRKEERGKKKPKSFYAFFSPFSKLEDGLLSSGYVARFLVLRSQVGLFDVISMRCDAMRYERRVLVGFVDDRLTIRRRNGEA